jgi:septal ring factor EnvC (AmiA/AmiB activator)
MKTLLWWVTVVAVVATVVVASPDVDFDSGVVDTATMFVDTDEPLPEDDAPTTTATTAASLDPPPLSAADPDPDALPDLTEVSVPAARSAKMSSKVLAKSHRVAEESAARYLRKQEEKRKMALLRTHPRRHVKVHVGTDLDTTTVLRRVYPKDRIGVGTAIHALATKMKLQHRNFGLHHRVLSFATNKAQIMTTDSPSGSGYKEMGAILKAVEAYEEKIKTEIAQAAATIVKTRQDCHNIITSTWTTITDTTNHIMSVQADIVDMHNQVNSHKLDMARSKSEIVNFERTISVLTTEKQDFDAGYFERLDQRLKEIETLKKSLALSCTFKDFKDTDTCKDVLAHPDHELKATTAEEHDLQALIKKSQEFSIANRKKWEAQQAVDDKQALENPNQASPEQKNTVATPTPTAAGLQRRQLDEEAALGVRRKALRGNLEALLASSKLSSSVSSLARSLLQAVALDDGDKTGSLVKLLLDLKLRIIGEQKKETLDWMEQDKETHQRLVDQERSIQAEVERQDQLSTHIHDLYGRIAEAYQGLIQMYATLDAAFKSLRHENERCETAENSYEELRTGLEREIDAIAKLRSLLRVLENSSLPKCPYDCNPKIDTAGTCADFGVVSGGWNSGTWWQFQVGSTIFNASKDGVERGVHLIVVDPKTLAVTTRKAFDTHASSSQAAALVTALKAVPANSVVGLLCADECTRNKSDAMVTELKGLGSKLWGTDKLAYRSSWAMIALKGVGLIRESVSADKRVDIKWAVCKGDVKADATQNRGSCVWQGRMGSESYCVCSDRYYGAACQNKTAPGAHRAFYMASDSNVCHGNGVANPFDGSCQCKNGYYHGPFSACEFKKCPTPANSDDECGGVNRGTCNKMSGTCDCKSAYAGSACGERKCLAANGMLYPASNTLACSGHGACDKDTGVCSCSRPYVGAACNLQSCPSNCNGRGTCDARTGTCSCRSPYKGIECEQQSCPNNCGGPSNGWCDSFSGKCQCHNGYSGATCGLAQQCDRTVVNWWSSFDRKGWSTCGAGMLLTGLWRNDRGCEAIYCLEQVECARPCEGGAERLSLDSCYHADWWSSFDREGWSLCQWDYYMAGLWRNDCQSLYCIELALCCRIAGGVYNFCDNTSWWSSFDNKGWSRVRDQRQFIVGFYRSVGHRLSNLEEVRGCSFNRRV